MPEKARGLNTGIDDVSDKSNYTVSFNQEVQKQDMSEDNPSNQTNGKIDLKILVPMKKMRTFSNPAFSSSLDNWYLFHLSYYLIIVEFLKNVINGKNDALKHKRTSINRISGKRRSLALLVHTFPRRCLNGGRGRWHAAAHLLPKLLLKQ